MRSDPLGHDRILRRPRVAHPLTGSRSPEMDSRVNSCVDPAGTWPRWQGKGRRCRGTWAIPGRLVRGSASLPCACFGYRTLPGPSPTAEICPVCFWQDDLVDNQDAQTLGPNHVTLSAARDDYRAVGAPEERFVRLVRPPGPREGPPTPWTQPPPG